MRFLIIGCGGSGAIHATYLGNAGHEVAVYDLDPARAGGLAARTRSVAVADTDGDYDCAVVCVPANQHHEVAEAQLLTGRQVVCEKPLALTAEDALHLAQFSDPARLFIAESQAYGGADGLDVLRMKDRIEAGEFGDGGVLWRVCAMTAWRPQAWCGDLSVGGGAFLEGGAHVATVARLLFGEAVRWQGSFQSVNRGTMIVDYVAGHQLLLQIGWDTEGCFAGECEALPNTAGLIGNRRCEAWWPGDDHAAMWRHLLWCLSGAAQPVATLAMAAGAVGDIVKCYAAGGYSLG